MRELEMIECKEDIGQLTEELAFLTREIIGKAKLAVQLDGEIDALDRRRSKIASALQDAQNKLSGLLREIK